MTSPVRVLDVGPLARLLEVPPGSAGAWADALRSQRLAGVVDVVPAAHTVLVCCAHRAAAALVTDRVAEIEVTAADPQAGGHAVEIPVVYDGADLDTVARATGLTRDEVVTRHTGSGFRVDFCGFAPGFAYLAGLDVALWLPRRESPRERVPAGAVAIANEYSAVYPGATPGGWHLLGTTTARVWDVARDPPSLLEPGVAVRFVAT